MTEAPAVCAEVLLDLPARRVDRRLTYRIPPPLVSEVTVGSAVSVPLGTRPARGFVLSLSPDLHAGLPLRDIKAVVGPPVFSASMLALARRVADETVSTLLEAVHCLAPAEIFRRRRVRTVPDARPALVSIAANGTAPVRVGPRQARLLAVLRARGAVPAFELERDGGRPALRRLMAHGAVLVTPSAPPPPAVAPAPPAEEPETCVWGGAAARRAWIVDAARSARARGGQVLVIVPAIARIAEFARLFAPVLGPETVVLHSGMGARERQAAWARCAAQQAGVVLGTRSALFAPLGNARLIVVDDEHDTAHRSEAAPRYHARDVARWRAAREAARVVLASATPSMEVYGDIAAGRVRCVRLAPDPPPAVRLIDMRLERAEGRYGLLAPPFICAIRRHLRARGRVAVFVNRTGYARVLVCAECGGAVRCGRCGVAMSYDHDAPAVACRLCGTGAPAPATCPHCGGVRLRGLGPGTERVEEVLRRVFPDWRVARLDRETAPQAPSIAADFTAGRLRLLVGTQMLLRAPEIRASLVGVVDADLGLHRPDFRGAERTLQQLRAVTALAAGISGGEAVVQTRVPDHPVLRALATGDDEAVYRAELAMRRALGYPPFAALARLVASSPRKDDAAAAAARLVEIARGCGVEALGPAPGRDSGRRGVFRYQCLLRAPAPAAEAVRAAARAASEDAARRRVSVAVEVNPQEFE